MTGTSLDGLDVVLGRIDGHGLALSGRCLGLVSRPLGALADELGHFAAGRPAEAVRYVAAGRKLGRLYAEAVVELCRQALPAGAKLDFVVAHGQTIVHAPGTVACGLSWQLFDPWPLVRRLGVPVCYDLRQADLIAGGQGAPITPLSDWVLYRQGATGRAVVNLGGICNVTFLPADCEPRDVRAEDVGPCNLLIDGAVRWAFPQLRYDDGGVLGAAGRRSRVMYDLMRASAPFLDRPRPRTTGREDFGQTWLRGLLDGAGLAGRDAVAAATDAAARLIAEHVAQLDGDIDVVLAGGGAHNAFLVELIRQQLPSRAQATTSDVLGIPNAAREALGLAVLGALTQDGVPITLPQVTAADAPGRAGAWVYP